MNRRILTLLAPFLLPLALAAQTELPVRVEPFLQQVAEYEPPVDDAGASPPATPAPGPTADAPGDVREVITDAAIRIAAASSTGLYLKDGSDTVWRRLLPRDGDRSWAPVDVRAVEFDYDGRLWFASPQGLGSLDEMTGAWRLYDRQDGLPWNDFTSLAAAPDGSIWAGTTRGLVRLIPGTAPGDPPRWQYRQGRRWLPHDHVLEVQVDRDGTVRVETPAGPGAIHLRPMTLRRKAERFHEAIDRFHRRTPYGYVLGVALEQPGDTSAFRQSDSDNDGLWTSMYGAAECFRWAVTGEPEARENARKAFEALRFLQLVTQGGTPPAEPGFVARTILPADGPDPNAGPRRERPPLSRGTRRPVEGDRSPLADQRRRPVVLEERHELRRAGLVTSSSTASTTTWSRTATPNAPRSVRQCSRSSTTWSTTAAPWSTTTASARAGRCSAPTN